MKKMTDTTEQKKNKPMPLTGIKILEYGVFHAGPGSTAILGDLGADIIKIESGFGDPERYWTKVAEIDMAMPNGESIMHEVSNRNKRGIYLDITTEKGREIFHQLIREADVFLTNLRKTTKKKLGIDYETLSAVNPKIIHANVSGYGPEGPMSNIGAFDPLGQARSGLMFATGSSEPTMLHLGVLDQATAIAASHAILTALLVKERQGIGQEIHVSLYSTALWMQHPNMMLSSALSVNPCVTGVRTHHSPLRNRFQCKDGKWIIGTHHPEEKYWSDFCKAMGKETLLKDRKYTDEAVRPVTSPELIEMFDAAFLEKTRDQWMEVFQPLGLMFCPVLHVTEVEHDPQAIVNGYVVPYEHRSLGKINIPGYPIHFSANSAGTRFSAPGIGEHTAEILKEIGYESEEIENLKKQGIVK
jgi:crotonobetainyl-CoA:carnitine CoA-transferase CaiB-like acyl-CoA transferase